MHRQINSKDKEHKLNPNAQEYNPDVPYEICEEPSESVPVEVKPWFYAERHPPNIIKDYDAIGFDMDHCLAKFNIDELTKHVVHLYLEELH